MTDRPMVRVSFRANDNGQVFPVYFEADASLEAKVAEAAAKLNAVEHSRQPSTALLMQMEQLTVLLDGR